MKCGQCARTLGQLEEKMVVIQKEVRIPTYCAKKPMTLAPHHLFTFALLALTLAPVAHAEQLPRPDHIVVVIEENRGYSQIMDKLHSDSYIHALAKRGMLFTQSYGV